MIFSQSYDQLNRRSLLQVGAGVTLWGALAGCVTAPPTWSSGDPFQLGVASGEPSPDGFAIWTRLAPQPLSNDPAMPGGMARGDVLVNYVIASDASMRVVVQRGVAIAEARFAHSVHHEVRGLMPGRPYWYQFSCGGAQSRIGRAITAPVLGAPLSRLRYAFVSCSNYEIGYFSAYRHLAAESPDLVIFLGDYIYEHIESRHPTIRRHSDGVEASTLPTYRNRYAQYRLDPDLQNLHASTSALTTWDDHEVQNDYADQWSQTFDNPARFLTRRAAAYQAFYEHMPVRPSLSRPSGARMRVYDRFQFGDLAQIYLLDGRQYRSREACYAPPHGGGHVETDAHCPERLSANRSMIGMAQEAWLFDEVAHSKTRWNIIAQDVLMAELREAQADGTTGFWTDDWNGYPASRMRLLQHLHDGRVANPVVLSGDIHSFWANDLKLNFDDRDAPIVATELVGTSVTSPGPDYNQFARYVADNPHVKFFDSRKRGYVSVDLTPERMVSRFQTVSDVRDPNAALSTLRTFVVENGKAGAVAA